MKIKCSKKFNSLDSMIEDMEHALSEGNIESSKEPCTSTKGCQYSKDDDIEESDDLVFL